MNQRSCRRHYLLDGLCIICGAVERSEHRGLDHKGVIRNCVQEIHFCWGAEDDFSYERKWISKSGGRE